MSITLALEALGALPVTGVAHHFGIEALPNQLSRAQLPCLLVMPLDTEQGIFQERGQGFVMSAFENGAKTVQFTTSHWLLVAPVSQGVGLRAHLPTLITLTDAYLIALKDDPLLGGALLEPAKVTLECKVLAWGEGAFYGCVFRHTWLIGL